MKKQVSPIERLVMEEEAQEIGGVISQLFGEQGAGKTMALVNKALIDFHKDRIVMWRGQPTCQWILLAANELPITLWMHETFKDFQFYLTGSKKKDIPRKDIDIENRADVDVEIKWFEDTEQFINDLDVSRVNVYYLPQGKTAKSGKDEKSQYFYQKKHAELFNYLNNRDYMDHISILNDENSNVFSSDNHGIFWQLQQYTLPGEVEDFRKNRISHMGAGHSYSDVNNKYHDVKANDRVYMRRAKVHRQDSQVSQKVVNQLDRGEFVVPGFEKDNFEMPYMPHENIHWIPGHEEVVLKMEYTAEIPDIRPDEINVEQFFDNKPFEQRHLEDMINVSEASELTGWSKRGIRRKLAEGSLPGIKVDGKWILSQSQLINLEDVPLAD